MRSCHPGPNCQKNTEPRRHKDGKGRIHDQAVFFVPLGLCGESVRRPEFPDRKPAATVKKARPSFAESIWFQFALLVGAIFVSELVVMLFIGTLPPLSDIGEALLDAGVLTLVIFPVFYLVVSRPLLKQIAARREAEVELSASEEQHRNLFESNPHPMWVCDLNAQRFIAVNAAASCHYGYTKEEFLGLTIEHIRPPEDVPKLREFLSANKDDGGTRTNVMRHRKKDGTLIDVEITSNRVMFNGEWARLVQASDITARKRSEEALRRSESTLQAILHSTADGLLAVSNENKVLTANDRFAELWKIPAELLASRDDAALQQIVLDQLADPPQFLRQVQALYQSSDESFDTLLFKDGRVFERLSRPLLDDGQLLGRVWSFRDVTERKRSEAALKESEERFSTTFRASPVATSLVRYSDGMVLEVNDAFIDLLGHPREEVIGHTTVELRMWARQEDRARLRQTLQEKGHVKIFETQFVRKSGEVRDIMVGSGLVKVNGAQHILALSFDITTTKHAEVRLRESEERLRRAVVNSPFPVMIHAENGEVVMLSEAWTELTGYTHADIPTTAQWAEQAYGAQLRPVKEEIDRLYSLEAKIKEGEYRIRTKTGTHRIWDFMSAPLGRLPDGRRMVVSMATDVTDRKNTDEALRESEEKFAKAFRDSPVGMAIRDVQSGCYLDVNDQCLAMTGYSRAEVIGRSPLEIGWMTEVDLAEARNLMTKPGGVQQAELHLRHKTGHALTCSYASHEIFIGGRPCLLSITIDISERKRNEEALKESEERFSTLSKAAFEGIVVSEQGRIVDINDQALAIFGANRVDMIGHSVLEFIAEDSRGKVSAAVSAEKEIVYEHNLLRKDGTILTAESCARMLYQGGRHLRMTALRDITERKQGEAALRLSEEKFRTMADFTYDWECWLAPDMRFYYVSPACERVTGYRAEEFMRDPDLFEAITHPDDRPLLSRHIADSGSGNFGPQQLEFRIITRSGEERWIAHTCQAVHSKSGVYLGRRASNRDITTRKMALQELQKSVLEKEALLMEVHHRVKNNLQVIMSLLRLQTAQIEHPITTAVLKDMQGRIRSMALLHETLYRTGNFACVDLGVYLRDLCGHIFRSIGKPGIVAAQVDVTSVKVEMDQAISCGLLVNELVSNCIKHAFPEGRVGEIRVELQPLEGGAQLRLRVTDNGVGLPSGFDPEQTNSLGMQLVEDLAAQLQGALEIGTGPGASFEVIFLPKGIA